MDKLLFLMTFLLGLLASTAAVVLTILLWAGLAAGAYGIWALLTGAG